MFIKRILAAFCAVIITISVSAVFDDIGDFKDGFATILKTINGKEKYGIINTNGVIAVPTIYDERLVLKKGVALAKKNAKVGVIDVFGNSFFP